MVTFADIMAVTSINDQLQMCGCVRVEHGLYNGLLLALVIDGILKVSIIYELSSLITAVLVCSDASHQWQ